MFNVNLLAVSQVWRETKSLFIREFKVEGESDVKVSVVSSAKRIVLLCWRALGKSLIYIRKSRGPKTDPCGTPIFTGRGGMSFDGNEQIVDGLKGSF